MLIECSTTPEPRPRRADLRAWLSRRHALYAEVAAVAALYALYEGARGLVGGHRGVAERHASDVIRLERRLHLFLEPRVQHTAQSIPGLISVLDASYLTLHLTVTIAVLIWLHRRRPERFPYFRTALLIASGLSVIGYLAYPTAPPRLALDGIADTVSAGHLSLNHGLVSSFYNPYAAVPSMHIGYATILATAVITETKSRFVKLAAATYPFYVLLVIVATGNHFLFDAAAGALVAAIALSLAARTLRTPDLSDPPFRLPSQPAARPHQQLVRAARQSPFSILLLIAAAAILATASSARDAAINGGCFLALAGGAGFALRDRGRLTRKLVGEPKIGRNETRRGTPYR